MKPLNKHVFAFSSQLNLTKGLIAAACAGFISVSALANEPEYTVEALSPAEQIETFIDHNVRRAKSQLEELKNQYDACCGEQEQTIVGGVSSSSGSDSSGLGLKSQDLVFDVSKPKFEDSVYNNVSQQSKGLQSFLNKVGNNWGVARITMRPGSAFISADPETEAITGRPARYISAGGSVRLTGIHRNADPDDPSCPHRRLSTSVSLGTPGLSSAIKVTGPGGFDSLTGLLRVNKTTPGTAVFQFTSRKATFRIDRNNDGDCIIVQNPRSTQVGSRQVDVGKITGMEITGANGGGVHTFFDNLNSYPITVGVEYKAEGFVGREYFGDMIIEPNPELERLFNVEKRVGTIELTPRKMIGSALLTVRSGSRSQSVLVTANKLTTFAKGGSSYEYNQTIGDGIISSSFEKVPNGEPVTVGVSSQGPGNLAGYSIRESRTGNLGLGGSGFSQSGDGWVASMEISDLDDFPLNAQLDMLYPGEDGARFTLRKTIAPPFPGIQRVRMDAQYTGGEPQRLENGDPVDLFFPNDGFGTSVPLISNLLMEGGQELPMEAIPIDRPLNISFDTEDPTIARLAGSDLGIALTPLQSGQTNMVVTYNGGSQIDTYPVSVHKLSLVRTLTDDGQDVYRLIGVGPNITNYQTLWTRKDGQETTVPFQTSAEGGTAMISADGGYVAVRVIDDQGTMRSRVDITKRGVTAAAQIQIMPVKQPKVATLQELPSTAVDLNGFIVSSGFCSNVANNNAYLNVSKARGTEAGQAIQQAQSICNNLDSAKTDQRQFREAVKSYNDLVRKLKREGKELLSLEEDTMDIGAAIVGLNFTQTENTFCKWTLVNGGRSQLDREYTVVKPISKDQSACFNRLENMLEGMQPGMRLRVELVTNTDTAQRLNAQELWMQPVGYRR